MNFPPYALSLRLLLSVTALVMISACASNTPDSQAQATEAPRLQGVLRDFSGHWEKNFQLSDDFSNRFSLYVADIQRLYTGQSRGGFEGGPSIGAGLDADSINGLARFTEELTRMPLLDIEQETGSIIIDRENDFSLRCDYEDRQYTQSNNAFGADLCGWNQERMLFQLNLGGGLSIMHQFSLSPDSRMLNVTTRVTSASVAVPLVISNYYERFDLPEQNYDCLLTLTRSTVCSQTGTAR